MKVLTLHQPWATLIALGVKRIETRGQAFQSLVGQRVAIHAGARRPFDEVGEWDCLPDGGDKWVIRHGPTWQQRRAEIHAQHGDDLRTDAACLMALLWHTKVADEWRIYPLPLGAIVCTAVVTDSLPMLAADDELPIAWMPHLAPTHTGEWWHWKGPSDTENPSTGRPTWRHDVITDQLPYGDFRRGRFGLLLADVEPLAEPVPFKGGQGLSRSWEPAA